MNMVRISERQLVFLIGALIVTSGLVNEPAQLAAMAGVDAWTAHLLPIIYAFLVCYVFFRLGKLFPGKNIFEIAPIVLGKWFGFVVNCVILLHIWLIFVRDTRSFTQFIKMVLLQNTPEEIIILLFMLLIIYFGRTSIEVAARVNELFFPMLIGMILLLPVLLSNEWSAARLQPFLVRPTGDLVTANLLNSAWFGSIIVVGAFLPALQKATKLYAAIRYGVALSAFLLTYLTFTSIGVLGPTITARSAYPTYALIQQIHITDFLDRVDLFVFSIYFPVFIVNTIFSFLALLIGFTSIVKSKNYTAYSRPMGFLIMLTAYLAFRGLPDVNRFTTAGYPLFELLVQPFLILVVFLMSLRKTKQKARPHESGTDSSPIKEDTSDNKGKRKVLKWAGRSHLLLLLALALIVIGKLASGNFQLISRICAIGYILCLFLLVITTKLEAGKAESS
jgi:spore germination protein KB